MKMIKKWMLALSMLACSSGLFAGSYSDFFHAVDLDNAGAVQRLLALGFDPNTPNEHGVPALLKAMQAQSFRVAAELVADPRTRIDPRSEGNESPLMLAALRGQDALVQRLVARGAEINKVGWTALHYAAAGGQLRVVAFLVGAQAEVDAGSPNGTTALMMAAQYGNADTVKLLLESGADPRIRNAQGLSAWAFAQRAGRTDSAALIQQVLTRQLGNRR